MSSHIATSYLNSCLKVPIDPCNNCPAPGFSRPKMYLGRLSVTPNSPNTAVIQKHCNETDAESKWSCGDIKSLAKFYDSIPDYRDLNHLSEEEFYSTLNSLRSTCREFKCKINCFRCEDRCSTTTTSNSLTSSNSHLGESRSKKCKTSKKKKKKSTQGKNHKNSVESEVFKCQQAEKATGLGNGEKCENFKEPTETITASNISLSKSSKKDLDKEVENFKRSLQEFEEEFKRPSTSVNCNETRSFTRCSSKEFLGKTLDSNKKSNEKGVPIRNTYTSTLRERLHKSLSFNDLHAVSEPPELVKLRKKNKTLELLSFKVERSAINDPTKLSNYFPENTRSKSSELPKITVDSPSTQQSCVDRLPAKKKTKQRDHKNEEYKMPFELFNLDTSKKKKTFQHSTPSPIHPVARPNLAATLRAEISKKKVNELKNNCTYHDTTLQFDWEVRKTPAWKTLTLNETHEKMLQLRLATRKAEQALQQREYELNMELMRQRVKTAPLLLEGTTFWGPHVGKLTHGCQKEGRRHMCQSNQLRSRRRKNSSRSQSCRRRVLFNKTTSPLEEENCVNCTNAFGAHADLSTSKCHKINTLRKIYDSGSNGTKLQSRNSNHSTNTQQSLKCQRKKNANNAHGNKEESCKDSVHLAVNEIDSGDELSSLDRAFL